jgi:hypothetical protein
VYVRLQFSKVSAIKSLKSSLYASHSSSSLKSIVSYSRVLNFMKSLISVIVVLSDCTLIPLPYFFCLALTCAIVVVMVAFVVSDCLVGLEFKIKLKCVIDANQGPL